MKPRSFIVVIFLLSICSVLTLPNAFRLLQKTHRANNDPMLLKMVSQSTSNIGSDVLGFSAAISSKGYSMPTHVVYGSNALEHGVNLIEERTRNVICISGWNSARLDSLFWELEPRGFYLRVFRVTEEPGPKHVLSIIRAAAKTDCGAIVAMGCGSVIDAAKMAVQVMSLGIDLEELDEAKIVEIIESQALTRGNEGHSPTTRLNQQYQVPLLVTIPIFPSGGAELSPIAAIRMPKPATIAQKTSSSDESRNSWNLKKQQPVSIDDSSTTDNDKVTEKDSTPIVETEKGYFTAAFPDLCLVQPSLANRGPMRHVHNRVLALLAMSFDLVLNDQGFMHEMLAWDSIRHLIQLLDKVYDGAQQRLSDWQLNPTVFEDQTVHDDESDPLHRTQFFRRYGHNLRPETVEDIARVGATVASARVGADVGGLQVLCDAVGTKDSQSFTSRIVKMLPRYIVSLCKWADYDAAAAVDLDPTKAFIRTKLLRLGELLQNSKHFSVTPVAEVVVTATSDRSQNTDTQQQKQKQKQQGEEVHTQILVEQMVLLQSRLHVITGPVDAAAELDFKLELEEFSKFLEQTGYHHLARSVAITVSESPIQHSSSTSTSTLSSDTVMAAEVSTDKWEDIRGNDALPHVQLTDKELYALKDRVKAVSPKSPLALLSLIELRSLMTIGTTRANALANKDTRFAALYQRAAASLIPVTGTVDIKSEDQIQPHQQPPPPPSETDHDGGDESDSFTGGIPVDKLGDGEIDDGFVDRKYEWDEEDEKEFEEVIAAATARRITAKISATTLLTTEQGEAPMSSSVQPLSHATAVATTAPGGGMHDTVPTPPVLSSVTVSDGIITAATVATVAAAPPTHASPSASTDEKNASDTTNHHQTDTTSVVAATNTVADDATATSTAAATAADSGSVANDLGDAKDRRVRAEVHEDLQQEEVLDKRLSADVLATTSSESTESTAPLHNSATSVTAAVTVTVTDTEAAYVTTATTSTSATGIATNVDAGSSAISANTGSSAISAASAASKSTTAIAAEKPTHYKEEDKEEVEFDPAAAQRERMRQALSKLVSGGGGSGASGLSGSTSSAASTSTSESMRSRISVPVPGSNDFKNVIGKTSTSNTDHTDIASRSTSRSSSSAYIDTSATIETDHHRDPQGQDKVDEEGGEVEDIEKMGPGPTEEQRKRIRDILAALAKNLGDPDPSFVNDVAGYSGDDDSIADVSVPVPVSSGTNGFGNGSKSKSSGGDDDNQSKAGQRNGRGKGEAAALSEDDVFAMLQRRMKEQAQAQ